jgi:hypothetical protein
VLGAGQGWANQDVAYLQSVDKVSHKLCKHATSATSLPSPATSPSASLPCQGMRSPRNGCSCSDQVSTFCETEIRCYYHCVAVGAPHTRLQQDPPLVRTGQPDNRKTGGKVGQNTDPAIPRLHRFRNRSWRERKTAAVIVQQTTDQLFVTARFPGLSAIRARRRRRQQTFHGPLAAMCAVRHSDADHPSDFRR